MATGRINSQSEQIAVRAPRWVTAALRKVAADEGVLLSHLVVDYVIEGLMRRGIRHVPKDKK
jgi:hypothetical protein